MNRSIALETKRLFSVDNAIAIINKYLNNFKINGVTKLVVLLHVNGEYSLVYGENSNKILKVNVFDSRFHEIAKDIMNKYYNDRYDFFWNYDIKRVKLELNSLISKYELCVDDSLQESDVDDEYVKCTMMTDAYGNVAISEKSFIKEFLYHKFWQLGQKVQFIDVIDKGRNGLDNKIIGHVIRCGDMEVSYPHTFEFSFMYNIVSEYNEKLLEMKQNEYKRQLKMEGF